MFATLVALYLFVWMSRENKTRATFGEDKEGLSEQDEEHLKLGDRDVHYRYVV